MINNNLNDFIEYSKSLLREDVYEDVPSGVINFPTYIAALKAARGSMPDLILNDVWNYMQKKTSNAVIKRAVEEGEFDKYETILHKIINELMNNSPTVLIPEAASYFTTAFIYSKLGLDEEYMNYAKRRWEVFVSGRFVLCDIEGQLYSFDRY